MRNIKRISYVTVGLIVMSFMMSSCSKDEDGDEKKEEVGKEQFSVSPKSITLSKSGSTAYVRVSSNTKWSVFVNNSGSGVTGLKVYPLEGEGDGTVAIEYGTLTSEYYEESATIIFYYYKYGTKQNESVYVSRKKFPYSPW